MDKGAAVQVGGGSQAEQHCEYTADTITMGMVCPQYAISAHHTCTHQHHEGLTVVLPIQAIPMLIPMLDEFVAFLKVAADFNEWFDVVFGSEFHGPNVDLDKVCQKVISKVLHVLGVITLTSSQIRVQIFM